MDEDHLLAAVRYVALSPVRARLVARAQDWPWSSVHAHLKGEDDALAETAPVLARVDRFADLIRSDEDDPAFAVIRAAETTGRPLGNAEFIAGLERILGRPIAKRAPGRKPRAVATEQMAVVSPGDHYSCPRISGVAVLDNDCGVRHGFGLRRHGRVFSPRE